MNPTQKIHKSWNPILDVLNSDPYPKKNQAIGYSFAVNEDIGKPVSLRIIEKEIGHEINRTLQLWRDQ